MAMSVNNMPLIIINVWCSKVRRHFASGCVRPSPCRDSVQTPPHGNPTDRDGLRRVFEHVATARFRSYQYIATLNSVMTVAIDSMSRSGGI
jgi:hypothetical protein